jgi:hypothetical protein
MEASLVGLPELLDQLDSSIADLSAALEPDRADPSRHNVDTMVSAVRAVNDILPPDRKKPNGAFRQLQKHARFVQLYFTRNNSAYVRSNTSALAADMVRLRADLAPDLRGTVVDLPLNVEELPAGPAKDSLREALANYGAGTFSSAIVSAVNALEGYLRNLRSEKLKVDPQKGRLADVIDDLGNGAVLTKTEAPLAHVVRLYRNYSAHPSEFAPTIDDARMVIQFVFAKLKAR